MGHLNARTGKYSDSVCQDANNLVRNDQSEFSLCPAQRNSFDNELNSHGKRLLEICKSADLRILNGRVNSDSLGRATFHGKKRHKCRRLLYMGLRHFFTSRKFYSQRAIIFVRS